MQENEKITLKIISSEIERASESNIKCLESYLEGLRRGFEIASKYLDKFKEKRNQ